MKPLDFTELQTQIKTSSKLLVLLGLAGTTNTLKVMSLLDSLAIEYGFLDLDQNPEAYAKFQIRTAPLLKLYVEGRLKANLTPPISKEELLCLLGTPL